MRFLPAFRVRPACLLGLLLAAGPGEAEAQAVVQATVTAPASGWTAPVVGETVTVRATVGQGSAPTALQFAGFKLLYRAEAFEMVSRSFGPLLTGLDFDDSDGMTDGFRLLRHDANVYGTPRNAFSFSVALFPGVPSLQGDGRVAMEAVLRIKAVLPAARYEVVPGEVEVRGPSGALLAAPSATTRTATVVGGAGVDPAPLVVPEAGGVSLDFSALSATAPVTVQRSEDLIPDSALPGDYVAAALGSWSFQAPPGVTFAARMCIPLAHVTHAEIPPAVLELLQRTGPGAPWQPRTTYLLRGSTGPEHLCTDVTTPGEFAVTVQQSGKLPVELTGFTAQTSGATVVLRWTTQGETNNAGFHVEQQAAPAGAWQPVAFVPGQGTSTAAHQYERHLTGLAPGPYRFRLRQLDLDGTLHLSPVVEVDVASASGLWLAVPSPNPAVAGTTVRFALGTARDVQLALFDLTGRRVAALASGPFAAGAHEVRLDAQHLPAGIYLVRLTSGGLVQTVPFTVLR